MELSRELKLSDEVQDGCGEDKLSWRLSPSESWLYVFCVGKEFLRKVSNRVVEKFGNPNYNKSSLCCGYPEKLREACSYT